MRVFIVDDSEALREELIALLSRYEEIEIIGQAGDSIEAKNAIPKLNPDVVILDIRMPGGNGIEVIRNIKKDNPKCVVIMFTNYPYSQYRKRYMKLGADFFFDKSSEVEKVIEVLGKMVRDSTQSGEILF